MSISWRQLLRLFRLPNLLMFTITVILYQVIFQNSETNRRLRDYVTPTTLKKIDWHDYALIEQEKNRVGIGEQGRPAKLNKSDEALEESLYAVNGFNGALSDKIPLNRSLPDIRHFVCEKKVYLASLPNVSVVVAFYNEHWSTLLRTAFSVLLRSPSTLIKEVLLVDDASDKDFLKQPLDDYLAKNMPKVRVLRLENRSGLIRARLAGAKVATADVLLFLDSHTEVNVNWLPPLLEPITLNYRTVTCPLIDDITADTFEYKVWDDGARGVFDWEFVYWRLPLLPKDDGNLPEPYESPVMAGGLFAISRKFFWELGGFDPGLDYWGGEEYELSFKIWQCGGRMLEVPCSRVGHIVRIFSPFPDPGRGDIVGKNYRRVAEVWMDEYAQYLYARRPHYLNIDTGDISEQKALRQKLQCKPFRWFMTQIAFDLTAQYPTVEPNPFASGKVRPVSNPEMCIDAHHGKEKDKLKIKPCSTPQGENEFIFSWHRDIKSKMRDVCWELASERVITDEGSILLNSCDDSEGSRGSQKWKYDMETQQIIQRRGRDIDCYDALSVEVMIYECVDTCLEYSPSNKEVFTFECDKKKETQMWLIDMVDKEMMAKWDKIETKVTGPIEEA